MVFIFSAAFGHINHEAFIYKLRHLGIGGPFLSILIKFLTDRLQRVDVDGHYSEWRNVISGVPEGSILVHLLFVLYTYDTWLELRKILVAYVDVTTLLSAVPYSDNEICDFEFIYQ